MSLYLFSLSPPQNKNQSFLKTAVQENSAKVRRYMDSRSSVRQVGKGVD